MIKPLYHKARKKPVGVSLGNELTRKGLAHNVVTMDLREKTQPRAWLTGAFSVGGTAGVGLFFMTKRNGGLV
jgi:hypothetical protein